jgi:hypothetical protein
MVMVRPADGAELIVAFGDRATVRTDEFPDEERSHWA